MCVCAERRARSDYCLKDARSRKSTGRLLAATVHFYFCRAVVAINISVPCLRSALALQRADIGARLRPSSAQLKRKFSCEEVATFLGAQGGQRFCFNLAARIIRHRIFVAEGVCVVSVCAEILMSARSARAPQSRPRRAPSARAVQLCVVCAPWRIGVDAAHA